VRDDDGGVAQTVTTAYVAGFGLHDGTLSVIGTDGAENVSIHQHGQKIVATGKFDGKTLRATYDVADVQALNATLLGGNDTFRVGAEVTPLPLSADGGSGNDRISAGRGAATILGGDGNDILTGGRLNDYLDAGGGNNRLFAMGGDDELHAGSGNDRLDGGTGHNVLDGGGGRDVLLHGVPIGSTSVFHPSRSAARVLAFELPGLAEPIHLLAELQSIYGRQSVVSSTPALLPDALLEAQQRNLAAFAN
jgi:Ca2+-binding RTX toxin-like protein